MTDAIVYIHGKGGNTDEAEHYRPLFTGYDVIGFDYRAENPWEAKEEFTEFFNGLFRKYRSVSVIANSIGAFFTMHALGGRNIKKAYFISPVTDMERLITDLMKAFGVTEEELRIKKEIAVPYGDNLSWEYLSYVRSNPIEWNVPTAVLYGSADSLVPRDAIAAFAEKENVSLTVMENGAHWFHTEEQMAFLDRWIKNT